MTTLGGMRHLVLIQARTVVQDAYGAPVATWATAGRRRAEVLPLSGRELYQAQQVRPDVTHRVVMRYFEGLSTRHRLAVGGRTLEIESVLNPDGRKRIHEAVCKEQP